MKVLLIQPAEIASPAITASYRSHGRLKVARGSGGLNRVITLPPLGLVNVATPVARAGHEVSILDAYTLQLTVGETVQEAVDFQPDLIGISFYSFYIQVVSRLTERLRSALPNVPIVAGGGHPSAMPDQVLSEFPAIDYVVSGWGDFAMSAIVEHLQGQRAKEDVPGLGYRQGGLVVQNPRYQLPKDLDEIPVPDRALLKEMHDHRLYFNILSSRKRMDVLMTSRCCPYACGYCFTGRGKYAEHSVGRVMLEIEEMVSRGVDAIEIMDDTFTFNRPRADEILDRIIDKGWNLEFRVHSRVDAIDVPLLKKLKRAGTRAISYGMESGSDSVLKRMRKRTTVAQNEAACRLTKKAGILCSTSWILGYPGETREMLEETFRFVDQILPHTFTFNVLSPLPNTPVYREAKKEGTLVGDWSVGCDKVYVKTEVVEDLERFSKLVGKAQWRLLASFRYLAQVFLYWVRHPNARLLKLGLKVLAGRLRRIGTSGDMRRIGTTGDLCRETD
jgi:anaerobic magnesium-protoporphyrin IX monomethyl ester cyclase